MIKIKKIFISTFRNLKKVHNIILHIRNDTKEKNVPKICLEKTYISKLRNINKTF